VIPYLRQEFNRRFTEEKYRNLLHFLERRCGEAMPFRVSETPCFMPETLLDVMAKAGEQMVRQLVADPEYGRLSRRSVPPAFDVPNESPHPLFVQADFGVARTASGEHEPRLVEIQGFPSVYAFQPTVAQAYVESYGLDPRLRFMLGGLAFDEYIVLLRRAIVGEHNPENVVLLEINPWEQKTRIDFFLTRELLGIPVVSITDVEKDGRRLYYRSGGTRFPIERIYNRVIVDELQRTGVKPGFDYRDDVDVEWAGHPNWYFRISKFSLPHLRHRFVPKTSYLDGPLPAKPEDYVLKPLYSFAGLGVIVSPTKDDIDRIPARERSNYILQERVDFAPVIETPFGATKAEIRIMYIWLDELRAVTTIVRMGRGKMMGVDHNKDLPWVGASAAFYPQA
jgi:hypothetical protein